MREVIGAYKNGNYHVIILNDGTMIRNCNEKEMIPEFPDSADVKLTNKCDMGCTFCHEASTKDGKHGKILNVPFLNSLHPYMQLALGGGNVLEHPDLIPFLIWCKGKNLIPSITLNQKHFIENIDNEIKKNREMIESLIVSMKKYNLDDKLIEDSIESYKKFYNLLIDAKKEVYKQEIEEGEM